jgi:DnaJ family protein C protein 25
MSRYNEAIDYFLTVPKYRMRATEIAKEDGLLGASNGVIKKKNRQKSKEEIKFEEERILRKIVEDKMDIRGAYSKPTYRDVLWVQLAFLPITIFGLIQFYIRWFYKFQLMSEEYGPEEKNHLIRRYLKMSTSQYNSLEDEDKEEYLELELWQRDKFVEWKRERDEEEKAKLAESASYKRYRRWMKKGGPGQMTFGED